jgi:hypothetical protein
VPPVTVPLKLPPLFSLTSPTTTLNCDPLELLKVLKSMRVEPAVVFVKVPSLLMVPTPDD